MLKEEFEKKTGIIIDFDEYEKIEADYTASSKNKDSFCRAWKRKNAARVREFKSKTLNTIGVISSQRSEDAARWPLELLQERRKRDHEEVLRDYDDQNFFIFYRDGNFLCLDGVEIVLGEKVPLQNIVYARWGNVVCDTDTYTGDSLWWKWLEMEETDCEDVINAAEEERDRYENDIETIFCSGGEDKREVKTDWLGMARQIRKKEKKKAAA